MDLHIVEVKQEKQTHPNQIQTVANMEQRTATPIKSPTQTTHIRNPIKIWRKTATNTTEIV